MRMPEGRLSSTSLKMRLYAATALASPCPSSAASDTTASFAQAIDGLLDQRQRRRIDRQLAQAAGKQRRDAARVAGHVAAQADAAAGAAALFGDAFDEIEYGRMQRIDQLCQCAVAPIAGGHVLGEIIRAD